MESRLVLSWCMLVLAQLVTSRAEMNEHRVIEVTVVVDQPTLAEWLTKAGAETEEDVVAEIKSIFFEVNVMFESLRAYNQSIEIRLQDILLPDITIPSQFVSDDRADRSKIANDFINWATKNISYSFDYAIYLTKFSIDSSGQIIYGVSMKSNGGCYSPTSASVVTLRWNENDIKLIAKVIGVTFGAEDDDTSDPECSSAYVMHPTSWPGARNRWYFSPCSAATFAQTVFAADKKKCLLPENTSTEPIESPRMGELLNAHDQCKRYHGDRVAEDWQTGDDRCNELRCYNGTTIQKIDTPEGSWCGNGKQCFFGVCEQILHGMHP